MNTLRFQLFRDFKSLVDLDTQVPHDRFQFGVAEQQLHRAEVFVAFNADANMGYVGILYTLSSG